MKTVIAIDSFKGSLSSIEAGKAIEAGICKVFPDSDNYISPLADGGEGTAYALSMGMGGEMVTLQVSGPLNEKVNASYGIVEDKKLAIIEMSAAAGITLISAEQRNPLKTTTYGVGELINDAIDRGCRNFIVGIGGSATNDGGIGMLQALGFSFKDEKGKEVCRGAEGLKNIYAIDDSKVNPKLDECKFRIACDVTNPLCGASGCSAIFGPQKGATPEMIRDMDEWLMNYASITQTKYPHSDSKFAGTGAAGGLGFAFLSYMNAVLESGIKIILEETGIEERIKDADIVITGEGRLDAQTVMGKGPIGVAKLAKKYDKKVIAFAGCVTNDAVVCNDYGIDAFFPILKEVVSLDEAMKPETAIKNLELTAEQVFRVIKMQL